MNAIAALRTRSRSSLRCERNGMRPLSSSSSPAGSPSSVVARAGLTMLLLRLVRRCGGRLGLVLRDGTGGRLDQRADIALVILGLALDRVGLTGHLRQRQRRLRFLERGLGGLARGVDGVLDLGRLDADRRAHRQVLAAQRALEVADGTADLLVTL